MRLEYLLSFLSVVGAAAAAVVVMGFVRCRWSVVSC
jgi:hypothetical protein